MDRREAIKTLGGAAALATFTDALKSEGIELQALSEKTAENAALFVFRHPGHMSQQSAENLRRSTFELFKDTPLEHVPLVLLKEGMSLEVVTLPPAKRTKWRIVDQMIEEQGGEA